MGWCKIFFNCRDDFPCTIITPDTYPASSISKSNYQRTPLIVRFGREKLSPFLFGTRRNCTSVVKRDQVTGYRPKQVKEPSLLYTLGLIGAGLIGTICFGNLEKVPYTNRTHLILFSHNHEKAFGEWLFKNEKEGKLKGRILPEDHPQSVRVRLIAQDIMSGLQRGLSQKNVDYGYVLDSPNLDEKNDFILFNQKNNNNGVEENRRKKKGKHKGKKTGYEHMKVFNWEILVVEDYEVNAFCAPGGKIVVYTGLLDCFKTDDEIATILGHEIAHALGRHTAETITKILWILIFLLILCQIIPPDLLNKVSEYCLLLPFSRKMEKEADYIGLLLMSLAGYDPRVAPGVYTKLDSGDSSKLGDYLSTHPSGKKRAKLLAQSKVMEKALLFYQDRVSRREIEGFSGLKEDDASRHSFVLK